MELFQTIIVDYQTAVLVGLGLTIGLFGGLLGLGGGWLVVPALNILGFPVITAVGTSLAQMVGTSAVAAYKHFRLSNLHLGLSLTLIPPELLGVYIGKHVLLYFESEGLSESFVRYGYFFLLASIGLFSFWEAWGRLKKVPGEVVERRWNLPDWGPKLVMVDEQSVPYYGVALLGIITGMFSATLGIGGGIIMVPALFHLMGVATIKAVASTRLSMMVAAAVASIWYWQRGYVDVAATVSILAGAMIGSYVGAAVAHNARGALLRMCFAMILLTTLVATGLRHFEYIFAAQITLLVLVPALTLAIFFISVADGRKHPRAAGQ